MKLPINYMLASIGERRLAREEYITVQGGKCYYCRGDLNLPATNEVLSKEITPKLFPVNFFKYPIHLHHDHNTGMTIGAVHCYCNAVLWEHHGE
jgi:hypothetical protein